MTKEQAAKIIELLEQVVRQTAPVPITLAPQYFYPKPQPLYYDPFQRNTVTD